MQTKTANNGTQRQLRKSHFHFHCTIHNIRYPTIRYFKLHIFMEKRNLSKIEGT